jgi:DNA-binding HxlR family transcriptional regulator
MEDFRFRSDCPIASTLDLVGDKWTLLILRDMLFGARRFSDLVSAPEGMKRNILTDRLKRLTENGLVYRVPYQDNPPRFHYHLTPKGAALLPVIQELARWGAANIAHTYDPPDILLKWRPQDHFEPAEGD